MLSPTRLHDIGKGSYPYDHVEIFSLEHCRSSLQFVGGERKAFETEEISMETYKSHLWQVILNSRAKFVGISTGIGTS